MMFSTILKGIGGEFEINRVVGAFGAAAYVIGAHGFLAHHVIWLGNDFDLTAYCLSFPTGLGVAVGAIAGAVALKDRSVASAKVVEQTGAQPGAAAPAGVQEVEVVNTPQNPANVQEQPAADEVDLAP
jgi:hypothetical protein